MSYRSLSCALTKQYNLTSKRITVWYSFHFYVDLCRSVMSIDWNGNCERNQVCDKLMCSCCRKLGNWENGVTQYSVEDGLIWDIFRMEILARFVFDFAQFDFIFMSHNHIEIWSLGLSLSTKNEKNILCHVMFIETIECKCISHMNKTRERLYLFSL